LCLAVFEPDAFVSVLAGIRYAYGSVPCDWSAHPNCVLPDEDIVDKKAESKLTEAQAATKLQALIRGRAVRKASLVGTSALLLRLCDLALSGACFSAGRWR
jgi:hypothetical protein